MATERMAMRKIREVLRLRWQLGLTVREAARALWREPGRGVEDGGARDDRGPVYSDLIPLRWTVAAGTGLVFFAFLLPWLLSFGSCFVPR